MMTMRSIRRLAVVLVAVAMIPAIGSGTAGAAELGDYRWQSRPLLLFAPTENDPRLAETLSRIEASRCDFVSRDMVIGVVVSEGSSTLDGQAITVEESQRLMSQYAVGENAFSVVLIGKDGGEKLRVDEVPDLPRIYAVVDGMPMRSREMGADPGRC
jgi:IS4 transposase